MIQELGTKSLPEQVKRDGIESAKGAEVGGAGMDAGRLVRSEVEAAVVLMIILGIR